MLSPIALVSCLSCSGSSTLSQVYCCDTVKTLPLLSHLYTHTQINLLLLCHAFYSLFLSVLVLQIVEQGKNPKSYHYILANLVSSRCYISASLFIQISTRFLGFSMEFTLLLNAALNRIPDLLYLQFSKDLKNNNQIKSTITIIKNDNFYLGIQ